MGFRQRRSITIAPDVPMTFAAPTRRRRSDPSPPPAPRAEEPGLLASRGERLLYAALQEKDLDAMEALLHEHPDVALAAATIAGVLHLAADDPVRARQLLAWVFESKLDPGADPFIRRYVRAGMTIAVVPGVYAALALDRAGVGLTLAELYQELGDVDAAIDTVEQLEPTSFAALSLAELYLEAGLPDAVVGLTDGVRNDDDTTALLCVFRGIGLREQGLFEAARTTFQEALRSRTRSPVVRHRALLERARCYAAEGRRAMARKDLERILAEDSQHPGLEAALAELA